MSDRKIIYADDAINAITNYAKFLWNNFHETCNLAGMIDAIETLPSAQQWIPVSERLPEASVDVLVCNDDQKQAVAIMQTQDFYGYPMKEWKIKYCLYDCDVWDEDADGKIVAWMPLPDPWKGEEDE